MSTNQLRRYLDLLNEAETTSRLIANQPFIPGQPLSTVQMAAVDLAKRMGNNIPPDVQQAYDLAKQAGVKPSSGVTTNNQSETSNTLKNLIKPRSDSGNYIDPKTGIIMYVPIKSPKAGFDAPDPDPKPLTLKLLNQPEAQEIKNALRAAGLDIISVDKPSLFGSYPVAAVDPDKLAQALAATGSNNVKEIPYSEPVPPDDNAALVKQQAGGGKSGGAEDGPGLAGGQRCAICGTPKMAHSDLKHQFQLGGDARPDPVPQGPAGGDDNLSRISRIKDLQRALLAAGANLGRTGANKDGIDGDIGPLTRAAMQKYPDIAAKYADLPAGQDATPTGKSGNIEKLNAALAAIEGILAKYKVKLNEDRESSTPADQMRQWRSLMELTQADMDAAAAKRKTAQASNQSTKIDAPSAADAQAKKIGPYYSDAPAQAAPYSQAAQRPWAGTGSAAGQGAAAAGQGSAAATTAAGQGSAAATTAAGKGALRGAAGVAGAAARRALPGVGLALGAYDAYDRATQGDYTGAGISGLAGIASLFPGIGTAASLGLLGLNTYLDSNKTPTVAITAEDAKIIADNIKIIQDWQKDPANQAALTPELKNRIANVLKGVAAVGVPTAQSATPATPAQPATTPSAPAANPKVDKINQTLDSMDQLLKKNKYESISNKKSPPLTEAEHMTRLRDIVTEDWSDWLPDPTTAAAGYGLYKYGQSKGAAQAAKPAAAPPAAAKNSTWLAKLNQGLAKAWSMAKTGTKWGLIMAAISAVYVIYRSVMDNPDTARAAGINVEDMEQFNQLNTQLQQIIGDEASFKALPPEVQQKATDIAKRALKMAAGIANRKSVEPEPP